MFVERVAIRSPFFYAGNSKKSAKKVQNICFFVLPIQILFVYLQCKQSY